ncbi:MAG: hypothetical protein CMF38_02290 [Legionellaceae bacterium]|nr:hypothetical protein [Legionellaceae bacterium]HAF87284.1 DUF721 domain-containing protein [Legionellales bacterium]HCA89279.1 DUF721 domain-containing protein [Legionellales bacterium]|tara:strand:+ start:2459 stop:2896 length:438 start_codon:yes stop_codon:yes gene_type:complete
MNRINHCMNPNLSKIIQQTIWFEELTRKIQMLLPVHLSTHCHVVSFKQGCLMLNVTDTSFATELRYQLPYLRDALRKKAHLPQLLSIKIKLLPDLPSFSLKPAQTIKKTLSSPTQTLIRQTAEMCQYLPLKQALHSLASTKILQD